ncbi:MAG: c-type cytochrome [Chlamydiia bacterium]|nr:c-type cytochrome [Chlamydiia bacterium]
MKKTSFLITPILLGSLLSALLFIFFSFDDKGPSFELSDPEMAPEPLKKEVMHGYKLMLNTWRMLPDHVGDKLTCSNCHFNGGDTKGGRNNGIPLTGVAAVYPTYNKRADQVIDLPTRINSCFERSMNGKKLDPESCSMRALVTYLQWISRGYPIYQPIPWRGLEPIKTESKPDPVKGAQVFKTYCADCHGKEGHGQNNDTLQVPALWGNGSFNDGAGMHHVDTLAAFIHANMPYNIPELSEEEALNVAAYIHDQPRPHFKD